MKVIGSLPQMKFHRSCYSSRSSITQDYERNSSVQKKVSFTKVIYKTPSTVRNDSSETPTLQVELRPVSRPQSENESDSLLPLGLTHIPSTTSRTQSQLQGLPAIPRCISMKQENDPSNEFSNLLEKKKYADEDLGNFNTQIQILTDLRRVTEQMPSEFLIFQSTNMFRRAEIKISQQLKQNRIDKIDELIQKVKDEQTTAEARRRANQAMIEKCQEEAKHNPLQSSTQVSDPQLQVDKQSGYHPRLIIAKLAIFRKSARLVQDMERVLQQLKYGNSTNVDKQRVAQAYDSLFDEEYIQKMLVEMMDNDKLSDRNKLYLKMDK